MITGSDMKAPIATAQRTLEQRAVADISFDRLERYPTQAAQIRPRSQQRSDTMAPRGQFMHQVCSNETRSTCDKAVHQCMIVQPRACSIRFSPASSSTGKGKPETRLSKPARQHRVQRAPRPGDLLLPPAYPAIPIWPDATLDL